MSLNTIMFVWAVIALIIAVRCLLVFVPSRSGIGLGNGIKSFLDFSRGCREAERMRLILRKALAESDTDDEFEDRYKAIVASEDELGDPYSWLYLMRTLYEYRHADEWDPHHRVLAERYLNFIEREDRKPRQKFARKS